MEFVTYITQFNFCLDIDADLNRNNYSYQQMNYVKKIYIYLFEGLIYTSTRQVGETISFFF